MRATMEAERTEEAVALVTEVERLRTAHARCTNLTNAEASRIFEEAREQRERAEAAEAKTDKLEHLLARAYPFLTWPDNVRGVDPSLDVEFDGVVTDVEVAIQHLPDDKEH